MLLYPKSYTEPVAVDKPTVSTSKKTAVLTKLKAHMEAGSRGFRLKELVEFVQVELHAANLHIRDDEVATWVKDNDESWGWHPVTLIELEAK